MIAVECGAGAGLRVGRAGAFLLVGSVGAQARGAVAGVDGGEAGLGGHPAPEEGVVGGDAGVQDGHHAARAGQAGGPGLVTADEGNALDQRRALRPVLGDAHHTRLGGQPVQVRLVDPHGDHRQRAQTVHHFAGLGRLRKIGPGPGGDVHPHLVTVGDPLAQRIVHLRGRRRGRAAGVRRPGMSRCHADRHDRHGHDHRGPYGSSHLAPSTARPLRGRGKTQHWRNPRHAGHGWRRRTRRGIGTRRAGEP